jgi:hypothetical protein
VGAVGISTTTRAEGHDRMNRDDKWNMNRACIEHEWREE